MVTNDDEIDDLINGLVDNQWMDRRNSVDNLLGLIGKGIINSNTKLNSGNITLDDVKTILTAINTNVVAVGDVISGSSDGIIDNNINPGDFGVALANTSEDNIGSCVINGIITNFIAKTNIVRYENILVVPGGTPEEPYCVSSSILMQGRDSEGDSVAVHVDTIETDIDGESGFATNSLIYGRESAGVTHPILVNTLGELIIAGGATGIAIQGVTAKDELATENPLLEGMEYEPLGALSTDADTVGDKVPAKASNKGVPYVTIVDSVGDSEVSIKDVEADIDGEKALTTNALMYGKVSSGVTTPLHVDSQGDLVIIVTPGSTLYGEKLPTASCVAGAAIEFDITSFSDLATLKQINITQLTAGTYDYTFEIWEKDGSGYTPGTYTDHYLKIFSRDIDVREYSENIDNGLLYRDRDVTTELHCRIVNNTTGTTSTFNVSIVAINGT